MVTLNICFEFPLTLHYTPLQPKLHIMIASRLMVYMYIKWYSSKHSVMCHNEKFTYMNLCGSVGKLKLIKIVIFLHGSRLLVPVLKINDQLMK